MKAAPEENNTFEGSSRVKYYVWAFRLEYFLLVKHMESMEFLYVFSKLLDAGLL